MDEYADNLWDINKINTLSIKDLKCSLCITNIIINAIANDKIYCPNREIIRLVNTQMYIHNTYDTHKLQNELKDMQATNTEQPENKTSAS